MMPAPGIMPSSPNGSPPDTPGTAMPGWNIIKAQRAARKAYVSALLSMYMDCCSTRWRCRMGMLGCMWAKKKSRHSLTVSADSRPDVTWAEGAGAGPETPFRRFWTLAERLVWRCVSRSSLMTLAREPLGPFFWGMAL